MNIKVSLEQIVALTFGAAEGSRNSYLQGYHAWQALTGIVEDTPETRREFLNAVSASIRQDPNAATRPRRGISILAGANDMRFSNRAGGRFRPCDNQAAALITSAIMPQEDADLVSFDDLFENDNQVVLASAVLWLCEAYDTEGEVLEALQSVWVPTGMTGNMEANLVVADGSFLITGESEPQTFTINIGSLILAAFSAAE